MAAGDAAVGVTFTLASNNNSLLNDTSQTPLPPKTPGLKPALITSDVLSDYPPQYVPPEGIKTLSVTTLQERKMTQEGEKTPCSHTPQEGVKTPCFHTPPEGVRTLCIQTPQEGEKTPCSHTPQEGVKTPCVQSHIVFIQDHKGVSYQFTSLPFGLATAPLIFTSIVKEVRLLALQQGIRIHQYLDDWLIHAPSKEECHKQTQKLLNLIQELGFLVNHKKSELVPSQRFDFLGYHFLLDLGLVKPTQDRWTKPLVEVCYQCKDSYVHHWITCINGEDSQIGQNAYETFSMASQDSLEISDASGYSNSLESEDDTTRGMVVRPQKRATRRVSPPKGTRKTDLYRCLKRRLGRTLRSQVNRRGLVSRRKISTYQPVRNEGSFPGSTVLQTHLQEESHTHCLRQHLRGVLHKQTGRYKIRRTLRSYVENPDMVQPQQCHTQSKTCTWVPQCDSGRPLKEESDPKHRMVPVSTSFQTNFQDMGESPNGPFCNQTEHKTPLICLSDPGSSGLGCRRPERSMGEPGCLRLSPNRPTAQGCTKTPVTNVQATSDRPRLAIKTVVLGPSGNVSGRAATASSNLNPTQTTNEQPFPRQPGLP